MMRAKQKEKREKAKAKGKGKRPKFRCTDLWFDMYSSAELEFVICFFVFCICVCELRAVVQYTQGKVHIGISCLC